MAQRNDIQAELNELGRMAPAGYFVSLHIRFAAALVTQVTYDHAWQARYRAQAYLLRDPMLAWGFSREGYSRWSEIGIPDPFGILDEAAEYGLRHGVCVAHGPLTSRTIVNAAAATGRSPRRRCSASRPSPRACTP